MKLLIVLAAICAVALAAPPAVEIVRLDSDVQPESFQFGYETSDGAAHDAKGELRNIGTEQEGISVVGSYRFVGDDGVLYEVRYVADENGFQPQGAHLPQV